MVQTIEERARDYARMVNAENPEIVAHDYATGAKEEHLLLTEWHKGVGRVQPQNGEEVLLKLTSTSHDVATWSSSAKQFIGLYNWYTPEDIIGWRSIHE